MRKARRKATRRAKPNPKQETLAISMRLPLATEPPMRKAMQLAELEVMLTAMSMVTPALRLQVTRPEMVVTVVQPTKQPQVQPAAMLPPMQPVTPAMAVHLMGKPMRQAHQMQLATRQEELAAMSTVTWMATRAPIRQAARLGLAATVVTRPLMRKVRQKATRKAKLKTSLAMPVTQPVRPKVLVGRMQL